MGWRVSWSVTCDNCGAVGPRRYKGKRPGADSLRAAQKQGWIEGRSLYGIYLHLCADCATKPKPEWWPLDTEIVMP